MGTNTRVSILKSHTAKRRYFNVLQILNVFRTHRFSVLFEKVNAWFRAHPQWKVISCESLELKLKDGGTSMNATKSTYGVNGKYETTHVRFIR